MKLLLLHGPAINTSREKLLRIKKQFDPDQIIVFEKGVDQQQILASLMTSSLLSDDQLIILENPSEDFLPTTDYRLPTTLLLWFDHEVSVSKAVYKFIKENKGEIQFFLESKEKSIFPFLDLLAQNSPKAFMELKNLQKNHEKFSDMQYLLTMIFYLLRTLVGTPKNAPSFVKQKLEKQRKNFNLKKITLLYKQILEIDFKIKNGLIDISQAEFMLVSRFLDSSV